MSAALDAAFDAASYGLAAVYEDVRLAGRLAHGSDLDLRTRAASYVWMGAVMEKYVKDLCGALVVEIDATGTAQADLRLSLFALLHTSEFDRIKDAKKLISIAARVGVLESVADLNQRNFLPAAHPLDGRTIRTPHIETIWLVFGLPQPCWPALAHRVALEEVADRRNDIAHARVDPITVARRRGLGDLCRLLGLIEELVLHMWTAADRYLSNGGYRR